VPPFEDIWREHKRFIVAVAAGLVAFLGGLSIVSSIDAAARRVTRQNQAMEGEIRSISDQLVGREGFEGGVAVALEKEVGPATRAAVEFQPREAFALKEGDSPFIVYRLAIEQVEKARSEAARRNIGCPEDLGFVKDPPEERVRVHIAGADLAERVLSALVAVGIRSIETFRPGEADYVAVADAGERPGGGGGPAPGADEGTEAPLLRRIPLRVVAVGGLDALETFLSGFQRGRSCLEVSALKIVRAQEGLLRFDVELAALTLVPAAEAKAAKAAVGGQRRGVPRSGGRLR
jgi:hypothetical protein